MMGSCWVAYFRVGIIGSVARTGSTPRGAGGVRGAALLGFTSVLPTKVTPSSITSLGARTSPNNSVLVLMSTFSFAMTLPLILPRITTDATVMFPLITALSPRWRLPSELMSPSNFPSNVKSPLNFRLPLSSTSEFRTFLELVCGVFIFRVSFIQFNHALLTPASRSPSILLRGDLFTFLVPVTRSLLPIASAPSVLHCQSRAFCYLLTQADYENHHSYAPSLAPVTPLLLDHVVHRPRSRD